MTILRAKMVENDEESCVLDDTDVIQLEKRSKQKMRLKELERFTFLPLLKTKILNATIKSVRKVGYNVFELTISGRSTIEGLSGCSLFFPRIKPVCVSLSIGGVSLPIISLKEFDRLPFCGVFDISHCVFNNSLLYGTSEYWLDMLSPLQQHLFYIGKYGDNNSVPSLTVQMELQMPEEVNLETDDVLLNCVPIVNVEKGVATLSADNPIKKISMEKTADIQSGTSSERFQKVEKYKSLLYLLSPTNSTYNPEDIMLRRLGVERFHTGVLLQKIQALVHQYSSDFYAFCDCASADLDNKMNELRHQLKEIEEIIIEKNQMAHSGVYVVLKKQQDQNSLIGGRRRISIPYLLTDGSRANNITSDCSLILPSILEGSKTEIEADRELKTEILMPTFGGADEMTDEKILYMTAQYYHQTKDRIITKADVKNFCVKELVCFYRLRSDQIKGIDVTRDDEVSSQTMVVTVTIEPNPTQEIPDGQLKRMASELAQKINLRTTGFCSYTVVIKELDVC